MTAAETAATVLAYFGAVFWSIQLIPQIYLNYRRHHTEGLHQSMMLLWSAAGLPLALHNILGHQPVALQVQAEILTLLSLITWAQVLYYTHKWTLRSCSLALTGLVSLFAAVQVGIILGFERNLSSDAAPREAFVKAMAVISAVMLSAGVLRHYVDILTEDTVRGISWLFVFFDAMGDLTSLLSIVLLAPPLDIYATVIYASEFVLWLGMGLIGIAYTIRDRKREGALAQGRQGTELVDRTAQSGDLQAPTAEDSASVSSGRSTTSAFSAVIRRRELSGGGLRSNQGRTLIQRLSRPAEGA